MQQISFKIKKDYTREIQKYIKLIENLKMERDILLRKFSNAIFSGDKSYEQSYLLKLSANSLLADAYKLGLQALKMEMEG